MSVDSTLYRQEGNILVPVTSKFNYDAIQDKGRRRRPATKTVSEEALISGRKRQKAIGTTRDQQRNFPLVPWMIRQHTSAVSRFLPMVRTKDRELNRFVKRLLRWHGRKGNFDVARRHSRDRFMQLFECGKAISGNSAILKRKGWKSQAIEGDRIHKPSAWPSGGVSKRDKKLRSLVNDDGLVLNDDGAVEWYCICKRVDKGRNLAFDRWEPYGNLAYDGIFERYDDFRGKSPLLAAVELIADTKENMEYINIAVKKAAFYGLGFKSDLPEDLDDEEDDNAASARIYDPKFAMTENPMVLNLDDGDDVVELGTKTPSANVESYLSNLVMRTAMLTFDVPYSFFDGTGISYSGRIADANRYEEACEAKRGDNIEVLEFIYNDWIIPEWWAADFRGIRTRCEAADVSQNDLILAIQWMPNGRAWIDQLNQGKGIALRLSMGMTSTPAECAAFGLDAYDIADDQGDYLEYCATHAKIPILYGTAGQAAVQNILAEPGPDDETPSQPAPAKSKGSR